MSSADDIHKSKKSDPAYEERIVLFLDFLGFRQLIEKSEHNPTIIGQVIDAIEHIKALANESEFFATQRITQFSDSLVISYAVHERSAVFDLICDIGFCVVDLVGRGFLVRGAVAVGPLLHTDAHLFGPALVRAYEMESRLAKYPRVLVDRNVLDVARKYPARHHGGEHEFGYVKGFLREDFDGCLFLDYVSYDAVVVTIGGEHDLYAYYLGCVANLLRTGLVDQRAEVVEKYLWLYDHYLEAIESVEATPSDSHARVESEELFIDVAALPRFIEVAAEARDRVRAARDG